MKNIFYETKRKGKGRGFWLFDITANNYKDAVTKARAVAKENGDVISYVRKGGKFNLSIGTYSVYGGKK